MSHDGQTATARGRHLGISAANHARLKALAATRQQTMKALAEEAVVRLDELRRSKPLTYDAPIGKAPRTDLALTPHTLTILANLATLDDQAPSVVLETAIRLFCGNDLPDA